MLHISLTLCILFLATLISAVFGFGSALVAMPLLTRFLGLPTALALLGLVGPVAAAIITGTSWQAIEIGASRRLLLGTLLGIPVGIWLVGRLPDDLLVKGLGLLMISFGCYRLNQATLPQLSHPAWAYPFGFAAGVLGAAYNTNGPPVVLYGHLNHWLPPQFRATLNSYFLPSGLVILVSHGLGGLWTPEVWTLFACSLPAVLAAVWLGERLNQQLSLQQFEQWIFGLLIALGGLLLF